VAGLMLTTEAMVAEPRDESIPEGHPHPPEEAIEF